MREDNGQVDGRIAMRLDQKLPEIPNHVRTATCKSRPPPSAPAIFDSPMTTFYSDYLVTSEHLWASVRVSRN